MLYANNDITVLGLDPMGVITSPLHLLTANARSSVTLLGC
jgi:hypothetical protein